MESTRLGTGNLIVSRLAYGCYGDGSCEELFGEVLKKSPGVREWIVIIGKCGVRFRDEAGPNRYDLSKEHILRSVDHSLKRLQVDSLDLLLLHRPDCLLDAEEVSHEV